MIETAGFEMKELRENTAYEFISTQAANACQKYGVKSISHEVSFKMEPPE